MRKDTHIMHKTRKVVAILLFLAMSLTMKAQVFMMDGDENYRDPEDPQVFAGLPNNFGSGYDYYMPVGDGIMLLAALGGAYLLGKKSKSEKQR